MKIDELINELEQVKEEHGNLEVRLVENGNNRHFKVINAEKKKYTNAGKPACYIDSILDSEWFEYNMNNNPI